MEIEEFKIVSSKMCKENISDPDLMSIFAAHLVCLCLANEIKKERLIFIISDVYDNAQEEANVRGII